MNRALSQKLRFFTFICIALLVYVHGYNLNQTYLAPVSTVEEPLTFTSFFEYLFANGLLRFRIPLLFLISGFLYALYDHRPYASQVKNRFRTLMVPFLIWSALGLLLTFILQQIPYTARVVAASQLDQLGDNRPYTEIGWQGMLERWLSSPISFQLWFIFTLFIYNLLYPLLRFLILKVPYLWLPATFLVFFLILPLPVLEGRGLFFFSLGIWLQKKNIPIERQPGWFSLGLTMILFIGLSVIKTFMAFELEPNTDSTFITIGLLYQFSLLLGILAMWYGADYVIKWFLSKKWFAFASGFSFFIFGMHIPLLAYVMRWALMNLDFFPYYRLFCYLVVPFFILLICIGTGHLLRRYIPRLYNLLTGGRGF
jgi:fucose 4-O-acetylase-like acetyltransferase